MKKTVWLALALATVVVLLVTLPAICQQAPPGGDMPGGPGPGGPDMGGPMGGPPTPVMVVASTGVYVMAGPQQIYRLDPETLKVLAKAELPRPEPPDGAPGAPGAQKAK